ncbi:MAG: 4Fe-4S dicluster domain-containing protein [Thermoplasmata archaeon]|nr:4Fe-4S dicluster domain-containing protein [Thermoplasmata archaeon]
MAQASMAPVVVGAAHDAGKVHGARTVRGTGACRGGDSAGLRGGLMTPAADDSFILDRPDFPMLLTSIQRAGYRIVGPTIRDGAIVYGDIREESDLPIGWTDRQDAGKYRLERRADHALFGYNVGPHSWKKYLFPARERLWTAERQGESFTVTPEPESDVPYAFLGMRACELAGLDVTDRVFDGTVSDPSYHKRRSSVLRVAAQCGQAGGTCFCVSMGTGPEAKKGYDLSLTELFDGSHRFLVGVGTDRGAAVLVGVPLRPSAPYDHSSARTLIQATAASMGRTLDTTGIHDLLLSNLDHPRWEIVGQRCLSCTNCTMACPTCFCSTTEEVPDMSRERTERWRRWDSCFNSGFSEVHGKSVRPTTQGRYRQWLTHKLASWHDQFDVSGCIGCGRCITWCPVGIDLTEEAAAIRSAPARRAPPGAGAPSG